ncbi:hypothetical protein [Shewanella sp. UCD-KL12]|uniref:hypothetical protein n=1 Tax=Shewanella sp. UCD-KL12 TaxID=1917163 RepID=UPI0009FAF394|nr:hypothetical protein [Shewanella sp. UCD-KL12]
MKTLSHTAAIQKRIQKQIQQLLLLPILISSPLFAAENTYGGVQESIPSQQPEQALLSANEAVNDNDYDKDTDTDKDKDKTVDMSDPTAVYSSIGVKADTSGKLDASAGFAWGNNQLLIESKGGGDSLSMTYANMNKGAGFYAEASGNAERRSTSIGYVTTLPLAENLKIYPVIMAGYINDELMDEVTGIVTAGFYTRYNLGSGFHLGLDPFFTYGQNGYQANTFDAFIGFQHKTHRIRLGVNEEKELTLQYNIAFM